MAACPLLVTLDVLEAREQRPSVPRRVARGRLEQAQMTSAMPRRCTERKERLHGLAVALAIEYGDVRLLEPHVDHAMRCERLTPCVHDAAAPRMRAEVPLERQHVTPVAVGMEELTQGSQVTTREVALERRQPAARQLPPGLKTHRLRSRSALVCQCFDGNPGIGQ